MRAIARGGAPAAAASRAGWRLRAWCRAADNFGG